jgi:outer membrane immunogenic protein
LAFGCLAAVGAASTANAQERPFSWTGFYIGAHAAYNWTDTEFPGKKPYVAPPAPCNGCGPPRQEISGGLVGGQLGANYQMGMLVLGVEGDLAGGKLNGSVRDGNYIVQTDTIDLVATARARVGVAIGRFLPYATLGVMWEHGKRGQSCPGDPAAVVAGHCKTQGPYNLSDSQWHSGFVWGGGVEYAMTNNVSIKLEALRMQPAEGNYVLAPSATGAIANTSKIEYETTTVRLGVNYRLN